MRDLSSLAAPAALAGVGLEGLDEVLQVEVRPHQRGPVGGGSARVRWRVDFPTHRTGEAVPSAAFRQTHQVSLRVEAGG